MKERNKIYLQDCLQGMAEIDANSVDLVLCDPPYGTIKGIGDGRRNNDGATIKDCSWDTIIPTAEMFAQISRVLRPNGACVLFSQEPYTSHLRSFSPMPNIVFSYPMIWKKNTTGNALSAKLAPLSFFEDINVFRKCAYDAEGTHPLRGYARLVAEYIGKTPTQVQKDITAAGYERPTRAQHFLCFDGLQFGLCSAETYDILCDLYDLPNMPDFLTYEQARNIAKTHTTPPAVFNLPAGAQSVSNVLEFAKDINTFHPTQKPVALIAALIRMYSNKGDLVLDFCMGSGTTAAACIETGRDFIGFETQPEFYEKSLQRLRNLRRAPLLFDAE